MLLVIVVVADVSVIGGPLVQRIRLSDEVDPVQYICYNCFPS